MGEKYQLDNLKPADKKYKNPWEVEELVKADLDQPRTKIDLRAGAMPKYGGYVPGKIKYFCCFLRKIKIKA